MRGRVTAVLLSLLFLLPGLSLAVCDFQLQYSTPLRASYLDLSVDGTDLWAATGRGVQLLDRTVDPPRLVAAAALPGVTRSIRASNGVAYAASGRTIHVLRRNGASIEQVRRIDAGGVVNDLLIAGNTLFAGIASGPAAIVPWALANPVDPSPLAPLLTSSGSALSLAASGSTVFVADGDSSVDVLIGLIPQPSITTSLVRAVAVSVGGSRLYVSDGQQSEVFAIGASITPLGRIPVGITSLAPVAGDIALIAGTDRRYRVVDLSVPGNPVELFAGDVAPTGGSINRIGATAVAGGRFYIAGGDGGLLTFDASSFAAPFPLRSVTIAAVNSVASSTTAIYAGTASGISELTRSASSGSLTLSRTWAAGSPHLVHQWENDFLLSSSGAVLTFWTTRSTTPAAIATSTFRAAIRSASLVGTTGYALLDDGSVWTADLAQVAPVPSQVIAGGVSFLAANDQGVIAVQIRDDGSTEARFYSKGNFASSSTVVLQGAVATALAISGSSAVVFTFRGITVIDFPAGSTTLLPQSAGRLVTDLAITGNTLIDISSAGLRVWNLQTRQLSQTLAVPGEPFAVAASEGAPYAALATFGGVASLKLDTSSKQPQMLATIGGNDYHRKATSSSRYVYLFDGQSADVYDIVFVGAPRFVATIDTPGAIDVAASEEGLFVLTNTGAILSYSPAGVRIRSAAVNEGADVVPLAIFSVRGAPWVTISKGCLTTGCDEQTLVYDPGTLIRSAVLPGGAIEVIASGNSSWALFDLPAELRAYDTTDRLHPSLRASRPNDRSLVSLAVNGNSLHALGTTLMTFDAATLTPAGEQFSSEAPTAATRLTAFEGCGIVSGRSNGTARYVIAPGAWIPGGEFPLSGNVRTFTAAAGKLLVLTDYSLDIWASGTSPRPAKRRATR